jgi:hypothetical protein
MAAAAMDGSSCRAQALSMLSATQLTAWGKATLSLTMYSRVITA